MDPGVRSRRNMTAVRDNAHPRDTNGTVSLNGTDGDRSSRPALGWGGGSIWNNPIGSAFSSAARDRSQPRENGTYLGTPSAPFEGKTGSGSLVASSESDHWKPNRSPWGESAATNVPHVRSSGVSPVRKRSIPQTQPSQPFPDSSTSTYFSLPRPTTLTQGPVAKPTIPLLDQASVNFTSPRQVDALVNSFSNFAFGQADSNSQRPEAGLGPWSDAASVQSPSDDRRSVATSEYFGPSSTAPSRSGSLPPSRHGEPAQYTPGADAYPRYGQPNPRQHSSFSHSNGHPFQERSGSIQSDSLQLLSRLSLEHDADAAHFSHRPSLSTNGLPPPFNPSGTDPGYARDTFADAQALTRTDDAGYMNTGAYTPDSYAHGHVIGSNVPFRSLQFDSRSAPTGTAVRQSPFYSQAHTPSGYDHLYPSRADQALTNGHSIALVQSKLAGYQQQQERRNYMNSNHIQTQHLQHVIAAHNLAAHHLAANNLRTHYPYPYTAPGGFHMNNLPSHLPVHVMPGAVAMIEPPKGPRDHHAQPESHMSRCLFEFKQNNPKNPRRYELKDIYDHVVEFSGDQHGSRFIQTKLESANSDEKERVFRELQGNSLQLMQDVFGNYVIQKFFEHGDQTQKRILANRMKGNVVKLSTQMYGCRVVQKALEHILTDQQALLVKELERDVLNCVRDQNGNHVIQKAIECVPAEHIQFIIDAFRGNVGSLAVHTYGCRVIQRLLEFCEPSAKRFILQELHAEGSKIITDQYGNYVAQHVISHGNPEDCARMYELVEKELLAFSKHKFASNVVEKCMVFGTDQQRQEIVRKITEKNERGESNLFMLIKDQYGNYVIQKMLEILPRHDYDEVLTILKPEMEKAKGVVASKQLIAVEKKMLRFDRVDSVSSPPPQRGSMSSAADSLTEVPLLVSDAQSPQSSGLPSGNASAIEEPVHITPTANKTIATSRVVDIANT